VTLRGDAMSVFATAIFRGGNDTLHGSGGVDFLYGEMEFLGFGANVRGGNDRLFGYGGTDLLLGQGGHDRLDGGSANDTLKGATAMTC
jgi:Ca2+-binding RTX toxin-like protein